MKLSELTATLNKGEKAVNSDAQSVKLSAHVEKINEESKFSYTTAALAELKEQYPSVFSTAFGRNSVVASREFERIFELPRRNWKEAKNLDELAEEYTNRLKTPQGTWKLTGTQAASLYEIEQRGGLFGPISVGGGKTLITLLAPVVGKAKRPILLVPAALRNQTLKYALPEMKKHWQIPAYLKVIGYSEISLAKNKTMLEDNRPDMIIADECHMLKNLDSARTKRVSRYFQQFPYTQFVAVSGTVTRFSIMHYWHLIHWALKPDNAPLPRHRQELLTWARALDERVREDEYIYPGMLLYLAGTEDLKYFYENTSYHQTSLSITQMARSGYKRRLVETRGVIATSEERVGASLYLHRVPCAIPDDALRVAIEDVKETWITPNDDLLAQAVDAWRIMREMVCGFYYKWDPAPPIDWMTARQDWNRYVRHVLKYNKKGLDSPLQVWNDAEKQGNVWQFKEWKKIKDIFILNSVPVWLSDYLLDRCDGWLSKNQGICWVEHRAFGERLQKKYGWKYFGAGDEGILDTAGGVVASIRAHGTGKNLQQWNKNLVVCPPTSGADWEQLLGRTHRRGQEEDTVEAEVFLHHEVFRDAMLQAFADARFIQDTTGNRQRLLYCNNNLGLGVNRDR